MEPFKIVSLFGIVLTFTVRNQDDEPSRSVDHGNNLYILLCIYICIYNVNYILWDNMSMWGNSNVGLAFPKSETLKFVRIIKKAWIMNLLFLATRGHQQFFKKKSDSPGSSEGDYLQFRYQSWETIHINQTILIKIDLSKLQFSRCFLHAKISEQWFSRQVLYIIIPLPDKLNEKLRYPFNFG